ncbi:murein hydrolase activator EnvC family protein [Protaetiibacter larvae]|uniref:M23 family metallopeptidase n=1 Tax=Protaetiibacter larvae TaxID=2592654 RepID=A0A5C1YBN5_9MICO|nr:M23 family metallopeptidase [Protaetiibacter larvae]QEO10549.1 M23 family metallopeptidase [Protaetiibacter larvae]
MRRLLRLRPLAAALVAAALWSWPVAAPHPIVRGFVAPATPYAAGHRGIDVRAPEGAEVRAPAGGVVRFAGWVVDRPVLSIDHGGGVVSSYEPVATTLQAGDRVRRGDVIGTVLAGHCASPCLHLGVRVDGAYLSPLLFLGGQPRAVLLPLGPDGR